MEGRVYKCPAIRAKSKWPAIMFAANRTERVRGRISLLINSINTIKGIKGIGVPSGTRWANIEEGVFNMPKIICPTQRGKASAKVKTRWLGDVKT